MGVVDNVSTDDTEARAAQLINLRVRVFKQSVQNLLGVRITGVTYAKGEHVACPNNASIWPPYKLARWAASLGSFVYTSYRRAQKRLVGKTKEVVTSECGTTDSSRLYAFGHGAIYGEFGGVVCR